MITFTSVCRITGVLTQWWLQPRCRRRQGCILLHTTLISVCGI